MGINPAYCSTVSGVSNLPQNKVSQQQLDSLEQNDKLVDWIYMRLDYAAQSPAERIVFLNKTLNTAWRSPENKEEKQAWFDLLINIGYYELYIGDILASTDHYEKAYSFAIETNQYYGDVLEYVLKPLGNNYTRLGDYENAAYIHQKAIDFAKLLADSTQLSGAYNNLALAERWRGNYSLALQACEQGLTFCNKESAIAGLLHTSSADVLQQMGKHREAFQHVHIAINLLEKQVKHSKVNNNPIPYWLSGAYIVCGDIYFSQQDFEQAGRFYKKGLKLLDTHFPDARQREKAKALLFLGRVKLNQGKSNESIRLFQQSLENMLPGFSVSARRFPDKGALYPENTLLDALWGLSEAYEKRGNLDLSIESALLTLHVEQELLQELTGTGSRLINRQENKRKISRAIDLCFNKYGQSNNSRYLNLMFALSESARARMLLLEMKQQYKANNLKQDSLWHQKKRLQASLNYYKRMQLSETNLSGIKLDSIKSAIAYKLALINKTINDRFNQQGLPDIEELLAQIQKGVSMLNGKTLISFYTGNRNWYVFRADEKGLQKVWQLKQADSLHNRIKNFTASYFQNGPEKMINHPRDYFNEANSLYRTLWEPYVQKAKNVLLIPDGVLGYMPFDALITETAYSTAVKNWPFVIKKHQITRAYSLGTWLTLSNQPVGNGQWAGFFISNDQKNGVLPSVEQEYEVLTSCVKGTFYRNEESTLANLQHSLRDKDFLHISLHSYMDETSATPIMQLSDSLFYLFNLYEYNQTPNVVVLSVCRSAYGELAEGEGILSFARGFTGRGTGTVISGLWNVSDKSAATIIADFYGYLNQGIPVADALHKSKTDWIAKNHSLSIYYLPYFWAEWVSTGNNVTVKLDKPNDISFWYVLLAALLLAVVGYFVINSRKNKAQ